MDNSRQTLRDFKLPAIKLALIPGIVEVSRKRSGRKGSSGKRSSRGNPSAADAFPPFHLQHEEGQGVVEAG